MRKEQIQRYKRYFFTYLRHLSFKKLLNLVKIESKLFLNKPDTGGLFPHSLIVDISNTCNLHCPFCQMGIGKNQNRENLINISNYKKIVSPFKNYLFEIFLFNWGEPFLNKDIYDIISFNTENNIASTVSTNFNLPVDSFKLIKSGLDHLIISGDGTTQDIYGKHRYGGKIENVLNNLRSLVDAKRTLNSRYPVIEWQCLVTKHNEKFLKEIKKTALAMGADEVRFANMNFYSVKDCPGIEKEWLPENPDYRNFESKRIKKKIQKGKRKPCFWLWRIAIINSDGGVTPCCLYDTPEWGNIFKNSFSEIWNNDIFQQARECSLNNSVPRKKDIICNHCEADFIYK